MEWKVEIFYHSMDLESGLNRFEKEHWIIKNIFCQPLDQDHSYFYVVAQKPKPDFRSVEDQ